MGGMCEWESTGGGMCVHVASATLFLLPFGVSQSLNHVALFEAILEGAFLLFSMEQMRSLGSCNLDVCGQPSISRHKAAEKRPGELRYPFVSEENGIYNFFLEENLPFQSLRRSNLALIEKIEICQCLS